MDEQHNDPYKNAWPVVVLCSLFACVLGVATIPGCLDRQRAAFLCQEWTITVLSEAKYEQPEIGIYEGELPASDPWGAPLQSVLVVSELSNHVTVISGAKDAIIGTEDDVSFQKTDIHVRKTIVKGLQEGSYNIGKGLARGVIDGIGEATDKAKTKASDGIKKAKSSLMSRFRKKSCVGHAPPPEGTESKGTQ